MLTSSCSLDKVSGKSHVYPSTEVVETQFSVLLVSSSSSSAFWRSNNPFIVHLWFMLFDSIFVQSSVRVWFDFQPLHGVLFLISVMDILFQVLCLMWAFDFVDFILPLFLSHVELVSFVSLFSFHPRKLFLVKKSI